jgi:pimeloyl-ACP methyl ester carboxylesterase
MEMNLPHLVNPDMLASAREGAVFGNYTAGDPDDGLFQLLAQSLATDWDLPYEALDVPVLSMTGLYDRVFRVEADKADLAARIADHTEVIFDDAGHLIPAERPEEFTASLLQFMDQL